MHECLYVYVNTYKHSPTRVYICMCCIYVCTYAPTCMHTFVHYMYTHIAFAKVYALLCPLCLGFKRLLCIEPLTPLSFITVKH